jgi:hypothetical protein
MAPALLVIPGHRAAMSPEPMNTVREKDTPATAKNRQATVFMGSGFAALPRPGMTIVSFIG